MTPEGELVRQIQEQKSAAEEELFFSYRRGCLRGERDYGRGLAAIVLAE